MMTKTKDNTALSLHDLAVILEDEIEKSPYTKGDFFHTVQEHCQGYGSSITPSYLARWKQEDGIRGPFFYEVAAFAKILDRPIEIFIYGREREPTVYIPVKELEKMVEDVQQAADRFSGLTQYTV